MNTIAAKVNTRNKTETDRDDVILINSKSFSSTSIGSLKVAPNSESLPLPAAPLQ